MHTRSILSSSLCATAALAFQDTSPFFAFSNGFNFPKSGLSSTQISTAADILDSLPSYQSTTASSVYILVSQPGVSADDFRNGDSAAHLRRRLTSDDSVSSKIVIPEVVGGLDSKAVAERLGATQKLAPSVRADIESGVIESSDEFPFILHIDLPALPSNGEARALKLAEHDSFINAAISTLTHPDHIQNFALFYTSTPPSNDIYTAQRPTSSFAEKEKNGFDWDVEHVAPEAMHIDLKRDVAGHIRKRGNTTLNEGAPLFEKYNFLSPGIFMGLLTMLILFSIGSVGVKALGSLQVSYAAFSKEMGPQAQKKGQ